MQGQKNCWESDSEHSEDSDNRSVGYSEIRTFWFSDSLIFWLSELSELSEIYMNTFKHVIGSLGDIGVEVIQETVHVPGNIVGSVLKSDAGGKKQELPQVKDTRSARRVLEQYVGYGKPQKEPTVYEKKMMEEGEKKKIFVERKKREDHALNRMSSKPKQGQQKYGIHEKTTEAGKNVKAE